MFRSKLWVKALFLVLLIVGICSLAIALCSIPLTWKITFEMEKKYGISMLDRVYNMVKAKHQEMEDYREFAIESKKRELRNIVCIVEGYILSEHDSAFENKIPENEAQKGVIDRIRKLRYGSNDYIFISDFNSLFISHPDENLQGENYSYIKDVYGNSILPPMVEMAKKEGEGFHSYWWNRLGESRPSEKLTYFRLFAPWRWVYGTGVYIDDIEEELQRKQRRLIHQLREMMRQISIGKTGYMYIFDSKNNMIIHPNKQLEGIDFGHIENPITHRSLAKELAEVAHKENNELVYRWDRPSDPGNYIYDKISWVAYFEGFDWYIGSSVYTDELKDNSRLLAKRIAWIAFFVFVGSLVLGSYFLKRLLSPIEHLSTVALKVQEGNLEVRSRIVRDDEIGILAREFDNMVRKLKEHVDTLDAKVREKTRELKEKYDELEQASVQIMDSIQYAQTIQKAILPKYEKFSLHLKDYFIVWKPKDIIGGDLFWIDADEKGLLIAVIDCTGHGVPGAIMTMNASMALNWVIKDIGLSDPGRILMDLNKAVQSSLNQDRADSRSDDGLDIGICFVNATRDKLTFSGARIDLFYAEGEEIIRLKGDKQSIGYRSSDVNYRYPNHEIPLKTSMRFYMSTDGFTDQCGEGRNRFPFGRKRFEKFFTEQNTKPFKEQKALLDETLRRYMGNEDQRDDITVVGFMI